MNYKNVWVIPALVPYLCADIKQVPIKYYNYKKEPLIEKLSVKSSKLVKDMNAYCYCGLVNSATLKTCHRK